MPGQQVQAVRTRLLRPLAVQGDAHNFLKQWHINSTTSQAIVEKICPQAESPFKQTTVSSVASQNCCAQVLGLTHDDRSLRSEKQADDDEETAATVEIDQDFLDMTTFYSPPNPATGLPDVE